MVFEFTEKELEKYLSDKAFFKDENTFCLGHTLKEAGEIFLKVIKEREQADVGMVNGENK